MGGVKATTVKTDKETTKKNQKTIKNGKKPPNSLVVYKKAAKANGQATKRVATVATV